MKALIKKITQQLHQEFPGIESQIIEGILRSLVKNQKEALESKCDQILTEIEGDLNNQTERAEALSELLLQAGRQCCNDEILIDSIKQTIRDVHQTRRPSIGK